MCQHTPEVLFGLPGEELVGMGGSPFPPSGGSGFQVCTTPLFSVKQDTITGKESANWLSSRVTRVRDVTLTCIPSEVQPFVCV